VCETADFLGKDRELSLAQGDLLALFGAGAYGFSMSSNYNSRARAPELMVDGDRIHVVREREAIADMMRTEKCLPK
jgi:diaminopimelate decarboxylase